MFMRASQYFIRAGLVAASVLTMAGLAPNQASAANRTTMLVMAEDGDYESVPRHSRIVRRIQDAMNNQMNQIGFEVYDEDAVTMGTSDRHRRIRFSRADLIDIARNNVTRPGTGRPLTMRAVAAFETYIMVNERAYTRQVRLRITGRLLDPQSGRSLGNFEVVDPSGGIRVSPDCLDRDCLMETVGDNGRELGEALGYELARMLDWDRGGDGEGSSVTDNVAGEEIYSIIFRNLNDYEFSLIEEYLVDYFSGYLDHDIDRSSGKTHYVTYRSTIKSTKLKRNLVRVLDELDWKGRVTNSGNDYTVEKLSLRKTGSKGRDGW